MPAPWAADDPVGRAERPPHTIRQARDHPQHAAARRAALPASLRCTAQQTGAQHSTSHSTHRRARSRSNADARVDPTRTRAQHARVARQRSATHRAHFPSAAAALHSTINRRTAQYTIQHTLARAQQRRRTRDSNTHTRTARARRTPPQRSTQSTLPISSSSTAQHSTQAHNTARHPAHTSARAAPQTHARLQHTRTHSTRAPHASATPHTEHTCPHQQQQQACHNPHLTHARAHSPLPAHALGVAERNQLIRS